MKILLTDDQQMFRYAFTLLLKTIVEPSSVIEEAASGEEALKKLSDNSFDLLFLDISMPGMNGVTMCKHLRSSGITTPVIVLTQHDEPHLISHLLSLGVKSFLTKDTAPKEIIIAIKAVGNNQIYLPEHLQKTIDAIGNENEKSRIDLSHQEIKVIEFLQQGLTSKSIALKMNLTTKTIDTYRERILEKTKTKNVAELISFAFKTGLIE